MPDAELPTNADEMVDFVVEQTEGGHWGTNDLWVLATQMFAVPPAVSFASITAYIANSMANDRVTRSASSEVSPAT